MRRGLWTIGGALVLAASTCGSSSHPHADPTTSTSARPVSPVATTARPPTIPLPSTSTTVPDPAVVPPAIDASYVNAVLAQLNHVYGNAQRIEQATRLLPKSIPQNLRAIYGDPQYAHELYIFSTALQGQTLNQAKPVPGDRITTVTSLQTASATCIQVASATDYSPVTIAPSAPLLLELVLRPKLAVNDPGGLNPTPWSITYEMRDPPAGSDAC